MTSLSPSSHVRYHDGELQCDGVSLRRIAAEVQTPCFVYSAHAIDEAYAQVDDALDFMPHLVAYAVKANSHLAILSRLARLGAGADVVSGGELARALRAGITPSRIVFSGVGKTDEEIEFALSSEIRSLHVESAPELDAIERVAERMGKKAKIALRVNPDVDPQTHPYIATGLRDSKFGLDLDVARALIPRLTSSKFLVLEGIAAHIGSQLQSPAPIEDAVAIIARFALECVHAGANVRTIDAGGGWAAAYGDETGELPRARRYGEAIRRGLTQSGIDTSSFDLIVEPGRFIVANCGVLLTKVIFVKEQSKRFVIVDAAMNDLIRPALYKAYHHVVPVTDPKGAPRSPADVVGPICETGDFLALGRELPKIERGDLLAVGGAGAYAAVMSSNYNTRPKAAEVLVENESFRLVTPRQSVEDLLSREKC